MKAKLKCREAECVLEEALERMRRAIRKNEKAVIPHTCEDERLLTSERALDLDDSGFHAV